MAKRILVPIGDNERAEAIVPVVAALARDGGGTVRLLNVQPLQRTRFDDYARRLPLYGYDAGVTLEVQQRVLLYAHAHEERLESETLERLRQLEPLLDGVAVERTVRFGDVTEEIVREAEAFDADLIAMATPRPRWLTRRLSGKVARRVFRRASAPVMLLRA